MTRLNLRHATFFALLACSAGVARGEAAGADGIYLATAVAQT